MAHGKADRARARRTATALRRRDRRAARHRQQKPGWAGHLPDLTWVPLAALDSINNPVLRAVMARLRREAGAGSDVLAGFNSAL